MFFLLLHSLALLTLSFLAARSLWLGLADRLLAVAALVWANIVVTCLVLSCAHGLGDRGWFFRLSLLLALGTCLVLRRARPPEPTLPPPTGRLSLPLVALLLVTLLPIAWASLRIAATYEPNNYDSLTYHLPRAMFYLGQNTLAHFDTGNDRQIYFPFNYSLLQLFALAYSPPLQSLNFLNLLSWGVAGLAVFRLSRITGYSGNASLVAAWLALTSTQILAQATATTNDLPTGAAILVALAFALRWRESRLSRDALMAGLTAGLAAGSKLTLIYFGPTAVLILLGLAWQHWRQGVLGAFFTGARAWVLPAVLAFTLAAPFAIINLAEKSQWMNHTYDYVLNRPFSPGSVVQTGEAYLAQLFLEPIQRFAHDPAYSAQLNAWAQPALFPHWNESWAFSPLYIFPADLNEDHVFFGFAGPLFLVCALWCLMRCRRTSSPAVWLALLGVGWFLTYFTLNKWSLYNQRYFVLPLLILSPGAAILVDGWDGWPFRRLLSRTLLVLVGATAVWFAGVYLFQNSSRPYEALWRGQRPPPALPTLPPVMVERLSAQSRINFDSNDGDERAFLFMTLGRYQRFTAFARTYPKAYNVFSLWGFVRKVVYSNIEQRSSYTIVKFPTKHTAGVEFLGTLGSGQPAIDYYGLAAHPESQPSSPADRQVMVKLLYGPRDPGRFADMRIRVVGLNLPDQARLTLEVEYDDKTTATLASFEASGEVRAPVTRAFHRFRVRIEDRISGALLGNIDIPYFFRSIPPEMEAPEDPNQLFVDELVAHQPDSHIAVEGLTPAEGPYPQWQLPLIRWAKSPVIKLTFLATDQLARLELSLDARLQSRDLGQLEILLNGELVRDITLRGSAKWWNLTVPLAPRSGVNVIEIRSVKISSEIDWLDYLQRYPDVKAYVVSTGVPLEVGARGHYETFGKHENRELHTKRQPEVLVGPETLYYLFRNLRITGYRNP